MWFKSAKVTCSIRNNTSLGHMSKIVMRDYEMFLSIFWIIWTSRCLSTVDTWTPLVIQVTIHDCQMQCEREKDIKKYFNNEARHRLPIVAIVRFQQQSLFEWKCIADSILGYILSLMTGMEAHSSPSGNNRVASRCFNNWLKHLVIAYHNFEFIPVRKRLSVSLHYIKKKHGAVSLKFHIHFEDAPQNHWKWATLYNYRNVIMK